MTKAMEAVEEAEKPVDDTPEEKPEEVSDKDVKLKNEESSEEKETPAPETDLKIPEKDELSAESSSSELSMPPKQTLGKGKRARIPNKRYSDIILSPTRARNAENGEKHDESEPDPDMAKARSEASSPALKKQKIDPSNPAYLKPFEFGWKREFVYKANSEGPKRTGDTYYYSPTGKKVRTLRELSDSLAKEKDLVMENFTFIKEPLGVDDPAKEIVREAKVAWNNKKTRSGVRTPKAMSPKVGSPQPGTSKGATPESRSRASTRNLGNIKVKLPPNKNNKSDKKAKLEEDAESSPAKRTSARKAATVSKASNNNLAMENKPCQPCSMRCEGLMGMVPTLQCRLCLCLYHYECVGLSPHVQIQGYICKNCQLEHGHSPASITLPPLAPIVQPEALVPNMPRLPPLSIGPKVAKDAPSPPKLAKGADLKNLVGSVTSWLPHSSTIQLNKENEPVAAPRPQYVEYLAGRKFLIIPKHNVVSVSQAQARHAPEETLQSDAPCSEPPPMAANATPPENDQPESMVESPPRAKRRNTRVSTSKDKSEMEPVVVDSYLQNLSYGYNTLLYIFQYLKVQDLLRAGCVCSMWRDVAAHASLWRTVRMKNSQVHSFDGLANTLRKHGTVQLDLRKMLLPTGGGDDIWPEFSKAIEKVTTLRRIELCRCPAAVVEQLASTNPALEVLNAVTIKCDTMSIAQLSNVKNLKELRLKSTSGLTLTSDITALTELTCLTHLSLTLIKDLNKINLHVLATLVNLESLDLGECTDFPGNFGSEILIKLDKLEKLRLEKGQGICHTFEILDAVKNMPQLEQLELVNFDIKAGFDVAMGECSNVKKLLIIPTYISQSATTNHMVLGGVLRLQSTLSHFVWGVTLELLRVTELFVDQCEDPDKKDKKDKKTCGGDSIPVLKPVPSFFERDDSIAPAHDPPQVEILPLPNLQKLLLQSLPTTRVKILKIPFHATWRQSITDTVN